MMTQKVNVDCGEPGADHAETMLNIVHDLRVNMYVLQFLFLCIRYNLWLCVPPTLTSQTAMPWPFVVL